MARQQRSAQAKRSRHPMQRGSQCSKTKRARRIKDDERVARVMWADNNRAILLRAAG
eukprot:CAMPEP_0183579178 /NCGR_PEP_ID=MMETSP0371-20130417/143255_1 /TAXON_ID=268820 /ORGANISM="Peridinium aciculiferum, Strain PAER-2" /LENGTH=56 /DNA_ID=CAMNT_0025789675 /DNA_START=10 /DNA_END=176 /DNA_ORIENTATION=+